MRPNLLQVDLYENGTIAIVEAVSPELGNRIQRVRVQVSLQFLYPMLSHLHLCTLQG